MIKILGIVGSKRKNGNTSTLVQTALTAIQEEGMETELIFLGDYQIAGCKGCEGCKDTYRCVINDDMQKIYPLLMKSDAIILGSPTYFYNVTSDVKALRLFKKGEAAKDKEILAQATKAGKKLAKTLKLRADAEAKLRIHHRDENNEERERPL